jgi:thiol-disulfide isomerase/thioredoxin
MLHQAAVIALATVIAGCSPRGAAVVAAAPAEPRVVDAAAFQSVLRAQRGHPVIVNFWATWCAPCIEEFPEVVAGARKWRARGVRFVSISADDAKDVPNVKQTLQRFGGGFDAVLVAASPGVIDAIDPDWSGALPTTFLLDANGKRRERRIGAIDAALLARWLEPLLK